MIDYKAFYKWDGKGFLEGAFDPIILVMAYEEARSQSQKWIGTELEPLIYPLIYRVFKLIYRNLNEIEIRKIVTKVISDAFEFAKSFNLEWIKSRAYSTVDAEAELIQHIFDLYEKKYLVLPQGIINYKLLLE